MPGRRAAKTTAIAAVVAATVVSMPQAHAQPAQDALKVYNDLTQQAEKLSQDHLKAQDDLRARQGDLAKATTDLTGAQQAEQQALAVSEQFRTQVDLLTAASFEGARFNDLSALLTSTSQQDFLERMQALDLLAADNEAALSRLDATLTAAKKARAGAQDAQKRATESTEAANKLVSDVAARKTAMNQQVATARSKYQSLTGSQKAALASPGDTSAVPVPAGAAGAALNFALAERGKPYVFGSNGPNSWDCSSLVQAAYRKAGVTIPRVTYDQAKVGRAVTRAQVAPGDLIIYYAGQTHVAMAVDSVRAVHASTEGVPVRIADIDSIGPISVIRRVVG